MLGPHLAGALDLKRWAEGREASGQFPGLIRRLIWQTNDAIVRLEMRDAEGTGFEGYDGEVTAGRGTPMVPLGESIWELGVGHDPRDKANREYAKRKKDTRGVDPAKTTFVFATPQQWEEKDQWAAEKRREPFWADVRVVDADNICTAFEAAPAVHYWFSDLVGKPAHGVRMLEEWWAAFAAGSTPTLTPALALAGRADAAANLLRLLRDEVGRTRIAAPSADDAIAFVAAVLHAQPEPQREQLLSRALIAHDAASMAILDRTTKLLILIPFDDGMVREAELVRNNHVMYRVEDGANADVMPGAIDRDVFARELTLLGVGETEAKELAVLANRSVVAFRNASPARGRPVHPWGTMLAGRVARRAWLLGGWNDLKSGDVSEVETFIGGEYATALEVLRPLTQGEDPLFASVGPAWSRTQPKSAWTYAASRVEQRDLVEVEAVVQRVLGAIDPALELPMGDRWKAAIYDKVTGHSSSLRSGLAMTLALAGADSTIPNGGVGTFSDWAGGVVAQLLRRANAAASGQLWQSLSDVLPLLAEAAPDAFLTQVEAAVSGSDPLLRAMFTDTASDIFSSSPHTGLLWALERLGWSSDHAARVAALLARLAEIDPGGKLSTRPQRSLEAMFRAWLPQTSLPLARRMKVLDALERDHPAISWCLFLALLPRHEIGTFSSAPDVRMWKPTGADDKMPADYAEGFAAVAERLIDRAKREPERWPELVESLPDLPGPQRAKAIDALEAFGRETTG